LQQQAFAARDIARGFLGHLGNTIATLKFFILNAFYISNVWIYWLFKVFNFLRWAFKSFI